MKNHSLLYFLIFICSLILGYTVSTRFYPANHSLLPGSMQWITTESQNSIHTMNNGQRTILLISTTSISTPNPHLESIWLATYFLTDTTIRLLPIFPDGNQQVSPFEEQLDRYFNLDMAKGVAVLNQDFIEVLKSNNYWWSGYLVFDDVALTRLFNLIGGIDLNGRILTGEGVVKEFSMRLDSPQEAYASQILILQAACHQLQEISPSLEMPPLMSLLPRHILTDLDSSQLQAEMKVLYARERTPTCRFPTLEISQVVH